MLSTNYLKTLKHVDCSPETISHVMCTHLHVDHVGWNTMKDPDTGTFIPTFPNAKYLFNKEDFNHWQEIVASGGGSQSTTDQRFVILRIFLIFTKKTRLVCTIFLPRTARRDLSYESENSQNCFF